MTQQEQEPEQQPKPGPKPMYKAALSKIPDDRKLEIATHYADARIPTEAIAKAYAMNNGVLTAIIDELGLERRGNKNAGRHMPGQFVLQDGKLEWQMPEDHTVPEPQRKALENLIKLPPKPEPLHSTRLPDPSEGIRTGHTEAGTYFEVTVSGRFTFQAADMEAALHYMKTHYVGLRVTAIREA